MEQVFMISVSAFYSTVRHSLFLILILVAGGTRLAAQTPSIDSEEQTMLKLINDYRAQKGLSQLKISIALTRAADWLGGDMSTKNYFSHTDSLGRGISARLNDFGYNYQGFRGENLAAGFNDAARTFNQWKNSAGHNANMLNPNYNVIGISRVYGAASTYKWYWTTDLGSYVDATFGGAQPRNVKTVNAASYSQTVSPDSLAVIFGEQLTQTTAGASTVPLPTTMGGIQVAVNGVAAQLLYVSPTQVNIVAPASVGPGVANLTITSNGGVIATGTVNVDHVSPSLFTFLANGKGTPVAQTTVDGASFQSVANPDGTARALSVGTAAKPTFLVLYGTGLRRRSSLSGVIVTIGGISSQVTYAGAHARFTGLDQLNVRLPLELRGRGLVNVVVTVDGRTANTVSINVGN
jgi:uncharacterized protein (TIGR03437 family)